MNPTSKPIVAAFDFDDTLTTRDTLIPFLCFAKGSFKTYLTLLKILPILIGYSFKTTTRKEIKEALFTHLLTSLPYTEIQELGEKFAEKKIPPLLNPTMMERFHWHQKQGHTCIIISAAMEFYLIPWGKQEKFDQIIASRCQVNSEGYITGYLEGANCWGPEKVSRLEELLGPKENYILYMYGDSKGDKDLLTIADYPFYRYVGN